MLGMDASLKLESVRKSPFMTFWKVNIIVKIVILVSLKRPITLIQILTRLIQRMTAQKRQNAQLY